MKQELLKYQNLLTDNLSSRKRYLYDSIPQNQRLIWILWLRWVWKTTLLLQKLMENKKDSIYFSMDNSLILDTWLFKTVDELYFQYGVRHFYIDEIHKYKNWNQELKNIYDSFPSVSLMFSGSSSVDIIKWSYDLSRRSLIYTLQPLSFREFLNFRYHYDFWALSLQDIFDMSISLETLYEKIQKIPLREEFQKYLSFWEFPFFLEWGEKEYISKLENALNKIIYEDIWSFYSLKTENLIQIKQIFYFICNSEPGLFSANALAQNLAVSNDSVSNYLHILQEIGLVYSVHFAWNISQTLRKAKKVFSSILNVQSIPNYSLGEWKFLWRIRETFIVDAFRRYGKEIFYVTNGDFCLMMDDQEYTLEVGEKNKTTKQIKGTENSFLIQDDIVYRTEKKIPLWMFGFLY